MSGKKKKSIQQSIRDRKKKPTAKKLEKTKKIASSVLNKNDSSMYTKKMITGGTIALFSIVLIGIIITVAMLAVSKKSFLKTPVESYVDNTIQIPYSHQKGVFNQKLSAPITDHKLVVPDLHGSASFLGVDINEGLNISEPTDFHGLESSDQEIHNTTFRDLQVPHIYFHLRDMNTK